MQLKPNETIYIYAYEARRKGSVVCGKRVVIPNDTKILAQAQVEGTNCFLGRDDNCESVCKFLRDAGIWSAADVLRGGMDASQYKDYVLTLLFNTGLKASEYRINMQPFIILACLLSWPLIAQPMLTPAGASCDPLTGLCTPASIDAPSETVPFRDDVEIIYVGDPMCSWCWGISPALNRLERAAVANGIPYRIVLGGLRPDDSETWNDDLKQFLRHHWEEVNKRSGQPFSYALLEAESFNYNTEPACRAVVAARNLNPNVESRFFELTQHRFYVLNQDPGNVAFYAPICAELDLDYAQFKVLFSSAEVKNKTLRDFQTNRSWGVTGYPTVIFRKGTQLTAIARGYAEFAQMWEVVSKSMNE